MDILLQAFEAALTPWNFLAVAAGVAVGIIIGALPGLNTALAMAVAIPLTLTMQPLAAIGMLVGVMKGGNFGGAIAATLLNTPGEPSAAATALDAHPLAKQGKPQKALKMALFSSATGDTLSDIVLITSAVPLAMLASRMGAVEQTAVLLFSFTMIAGLTGNSVIRGLVAALLGILVAQVGRIDGSFADRFTFGYLELSEGLPIASVAIGILAMPEILVQIFRGRSEGPSTAVVKETGTKKERQLSFGEFWDARWAVIRGSFIGTGIGALPGLGSSVAAFLSYDVAKRVSKKSELFGKGSLEGIGATESANSAVNGANLIPLLTLGIPGNVAAALLVGAFIIHGVDPGPMVFKNDAVLIYGLFISMMMANILTVVLGQLGLRFFSLILSTPGNIVFPTVGLLCLTGVYISSGLGLMGVAIMIMFAGLGYLMRRYDYSIVAFVIGFVLGGAFESNLRKTVTILHRDPIGEGLQHPFALFVVTVTLLFIVFLVFRRSRKSTYKEKLG